MKRTKPSYDTRFKLRCAHFPELVPKEQFAVVSRTSLWTWRQLTEKNFFGCDESLFSREFKLTLLRVRATVIAVMRSTKGFPKVFKKHKARVVRTVSRLSMLLSLKKACKIFGISVSSFHNWRLAFCDKSPFKSCIKRHPAQLSTKEVSRIKAFIESPAQVGRKHWPVVSLYFDALRKLVVSCSETTFRKYLNLLGHIREKKKVFNDRRKIGFRASGPGQAVHIDVTEFQIGDVLLYLYLSVDNFSRMKLSWRLEEKLSATIRFETVLGAFRKIKELRSDLHGTVETLLISDGGPENKFTLDPAQNLFARVRKVVAQVDLPSSNSMAESANHRLKAACRYFPEEYRKNLHALLEKLINEQNKEEPHGVLSGFTPFEVFTGKVPDKNRFCESMAKARRLRIEKNRADGCGRCDF